MAEKLQIRKLPIYAALRPFSRLYAHYRYFQTKHSLHQWGCNTTRFGEYEQAFVNAVSFYQIRDTARTQRKRKNRLRHRITKTRMLLSGPRTDEEMFEKGWRTLTTHVLYGASEYTSRRIVRKVGALPADVKEAAKRTARRYFAVQRAYPQLSNTDMRKVS